MPPRLPTLMPVGRRAWLRLGALLVLLAGLPTFGWIFMIKMPGESFRGALPPLSHAERALEPDLRVHVNLLAGVIGERNLVYYENLLAAANYIDGTLSSYGYEVHRQSYDVSGRACDNLEAEIPGKAKPGEIVIIGAHYDSVIGSPGANDNATGVAALLTLARAFSTRQPARTLRFVAFVNEEPPLFQTADMGSRVYAKRSRQRGENVVAMISLETIGYYSDRPGSQSYPFPLSLAYPSTADFIGFVSNVQNGDLVRRLVDSFRRHAQFPSEGGALFGFFPGVGWSDHWSFWKEGYPAAMVTDTALFRYPAYHLPSDKPEHVQYDRMARVVLGLERVIAELVSQ